MSTRAWMRGGSIPTRNCDVLITFPVGRTEDTTLMWLLGKMRERASEICVHVRHHGNTGAYGFYLTMSYDK